jgi:hypothetical protein
MHEVAGVSVDAPKGTISPCRTSEAVLQEHIVFMSEDGFPTSVEEQTSPIPHYNFWYDLLYMYELIWMKTFELLKTYFELVSLADRVEDDLVPDLRRWGDEGVANDGYPQFHQPGLPTYYSAPFLVTLLQNMICHLDELLRTPTYADNDPLADLHSEALMTLMQWKRHFLSSQVHIFFACFRCLTGHALLVHPFLCPTTQRPITIDEFLVRFSWDTVGVYYMVGM